MNDVEQVNAGMTVLRTSALHNSGIDEWCDFLERKHQQLFPPSTHD
jgi:hypothetical protein